MWTIDLEYANELNAEHAESAKETQRGTAGSVASNCKQHLPPFAFKKLMYNETNPLKETLHSRNHKQQTNIPFPLHIDILNKKILRLSIRAAGDGKNVKTEIIISRMLVKELFSSLQ